MQKALIHLYQSFLSDYPILSIKRRKPKIVLTLLPLTACFITDYSTLLANEVHVSPGPQGPRLGADLGLGSCKNDPRNVGSSLITIHCIMHEPLSGVIFLAEL